MLGLPAANFSASEAHLAPLTRAMMRLAQMFDAPMASGEGGVPVGGEGEQQGKGQEGACAAAADGAGLPLAVQAVAAGSAGLLVGSGITAPGAAASGLAASPASPPNRAASPGSPSTGSYSTSSSPEDHAAPQLQQQACAQPPTQRAQQAPQPPPPPQPQQKTQPQPAQHRARQPVTPRGGTTACKRVGAAARGAVPTKRLRAPAAAAGAAAASGPQRVLALSGAAQPLPLSPQQLLLPAVAVPVV